MQLSSAAVQCEQCDRSATIGSLGAEETMLTCLHPLSEVTCIINNTAIHQYTPGQHIGKPYCRVCERRPHVQYQINVHWEFSVHHLGLHPEPFAAFTSTWW